MHNLCRRQLAICFNGTGFRDPIDHAVGQLEHAASVENRQNDWSTVGKMAANSSVASGY